MRLNENRVSIERFKLLQKAEHKHASLFSDSERDGPAKQKAANEMMMNDVQTAVNDRIKARSVAMSGWQK
jgi:hypothetical protein